MGTTLNDQIDARFGPICDALDDVKEAQGMSNGEMLLLLTILLVGNLRDAAADVAAELRTGIVTALVHNNLAPLLLLCRRGLKLANTETEEEPMVDEQIDEKAETTEHEAQPQPDGDGGSTDTGTTETTSGEAEGSER